MTTNLYEQFEQPVTKFPPTSSLRPEMSTTGFIHMKLEQEAPMFSRQMVNFRPSDKITHLVVSNDYIVLAMANQELLRLDVRDSQKFEVIELSKVLSNQLRLAKMYLDPSGEHLLLVTTPIVSEVQSQIFYMNRRSNKIKQTAKCRGLEVNTVAFSFDMSSESTTGPMLLGTLKGALFETEFHSDGDGRFSGSVDQYLKQVFDIGRGNNIPITGIEFHRIPNSDKLFILVTTLDRLYNFVGSISGSMEERPFLQQVFSCYLNKPERFNSWPSNLKSSRLQCYYPAPRAAPTNFAWLVQSGLYCGQLDYSGREDSVTTNVGVLNCSPSAPISFILTEFHALLMYSNHVKGVSLLSHDLVFEDTYNESCGKLINITKDAIKGAIWACTEKSVFKYKVFKEDRNVWQAYVEKGEFELAKQYCGNNPAYIDQVLIRQAEMYFKQQEYDESAIYYAQTQSSFEEISLKFLQVWKIDALKLFLRKKLELLKPGEKTQITIIVMWVLELFLKQLGKLRDNSQDSSTRYEVLESEFETFLEEPVVKECVKLNRRIVYDLIASHGDKKNLVKLTTLNKDYEKVIRHYMCKGCYKEALNVLESQKSSNLFYEFAALLIQAMPKDTVRALINQGGALKPLKLLPALIACDLKDEKAAQQVIHYLEYCVHSLNVQDQALHNYLLMLYAKFDPDKLMEYLDTQGPDASLVAYDPHYALRLCRELKQNKASVQLSALLGLWESAVDLALTVSVDLAKKTAAQPDSEELQRKLWLKIAKHVVSGKNDIKQAMEFLKQSPLVKIEDILPFFADFVTIDHFKDAICTSLQEYNQHIQDLKEDMDDATKSAELIREEIHAFRNRYSVVQTGDVCSECSLQLLLRPFYLFPCGHCFHSDCLYEQLLPGLTPGKRSKLLDLKKQLASLSSKEDAASLNSMSVSMRDQLKSDIDAIVAAECLYCGEMMIQSIDKPFVDEENYELTMKEWQ